MFFDTSSAAKRPRWSCAATLVGLLTFVAGAANAEIIWDGNFNDHNFINYHRPEDPKEVAFFLIPDYGRPPQYGYQVEGHVGNGDLLSLVDYPTRGSKYSAKFVVKSKAGGGVEPADCDPAVDCGTRRANLQMTATLTEYYNALPQDVERWVSISFFIPKDFDASGSGFGPALWGAKVAPSVRSGAFGIWIVNNGWQLNHRYCGSGLINGECVYGEKWWLVDFWRKDFPAAGDGHLIDFPDVAASRAALGNLNRGGWTDFIFHFKTDTDKFEDNDGFLDVFMRAGSGEWVHVVKMRPVEDFARLTSWEGGDDRLYDRGVGQIGPKGYTSQMGLYMDKGRVWQHDRNMVIYMDNHKIGDGNATFSDMSHDGSSPGKPADVIKASPNPPVIVQNE